MGQTGATYVAAVPHWFILATLLLLARWTFVKARRRRDPSVCRACGYDLRATPGRCPECGTAASNADAVAA